jgi:hypothetical protein
MCKIIHFPLDFLLAKCDLFLGSAKAQKFLPTEVPSLMEVIQTVIGDHSKRTFGPFIHFFDPRSPLVRFLYREKHYFFIHSKFIFQH